MPIRAGDGTEVTPRAIAEVRKGDGTVLYRAGEAEYEVTITDAYESLGGFEVAITDQRFTGDGFDVTITDQRFTEET